MPGLLKKGRKSARPSGTPCPRKSSEALGETCDGLVYTTVTETVVEGIPGAQTQRG